MSSPAFFPLGSELGVLETKLRRLQAAAHAPPEHLERAEKALAEIRFMVLRTHEAQLQVSIATSAGFEEHRRVWQAKIAAIDEQIVEATAALHERLLELTAHRFRRFAAAMVVGAVALRRLFIPPIDGQPPLISRHYLQETAFVSPRPI